MAESLKQQALAAVVHDRIADRSAREMINRAAVVRAAGDLSVALGKFRLSSGLNQRAQRIQVLVQEILAGIDFQS